MAAPAIPPPFPNVATRDNVIRTMADEVQNLNKPRTVRVLTGGATDHEVLAWLDDVREERAARGWNNQQALNHLRNFVDGTAQFWRREMELQRQNEINAANAHNNALPAGGVPVVVPNPYDFDELVGALANRIITPQADQTVEKQLRAFKAFPGESVRAAWERLSQLRMLTNRMRIVRAAPGAPAPAPMSEVELRRLWLEGMPQHVRFHVESDAPVTAEECYEKAIKVELALNSSGMNVPGAYPMYPQYPAFVPPSTPSPVPVALPTNAMPVSSLYIPPPQKGTYYGPSVSHYGPSVSLPNVYDPSSSPPVIDRTTGLLRAMTPTELSIYLQQQNAAAQVNVSHKKVPPLHWEGHGVPVIETENRVTTTTHNTEYVGNKRPAPPVIDEQAQKYFKVRWDGARWKIERNPAAGWEDDDENGNGNGDEGEYSPHRPPFEQNDAKEAAHDARAGKGGKASKGQSRSKRHKAPLEEGEESDATHPRGRRSHSRSRSKSQPPPSPSGAGSGSGTDQSATMAF